MGMVVLAEEINLATLRGNAKVQRNIEKKENGNNKVTKTFVIMDYEKILKGIVQIINTAEKSDIGFVDICTYIGKNCPELAESDDERIRKEILEFVTIVADSKSNKMEWIAWLEKQAPKPKWSEEDEKNWCGIIDEIEANKSTAPIHDIKTYDRFLSWMDNIKQRMGGEE